MKCNKCGRKLKDKYLEYHHILPLSLNFKNNETIILCKWCHRINPNSIHNYLNNLGLTQEKTIRKFTAKWLNNNIPHSSDKMPPCPKCKNIENRLFIFKVKKESVILMCSTCGYSKESLEWAKEHYRKLRYESLKENRKLFIKDNLQHYKSGDGDDSIPGF